MNCRPLGVLRCCVVVRALTPIALTISSILGTRSTFALFGASARLAPLINSTPVPCHWVLTRWTGRRRARRVWARGTVTALFRAGLASGASRILSVRKHTGLHFPVQYHDYHGFCAGRFQGLAPAWRGEWMRLWHSQPLPRGPTPCVTCALAAPFCVFARVA